MLGPAKPRRLDEPMAVSLEELVPGDHFDRPMEAKLDLSLIDSRAPLPPISSASTEQVEGVVLRLTADDVMAMAADEGSGEEYRQVLGKSGSDNGRSRNHTAVMPAPVLLGP